MWRYRCGGGSIWGAVMVEIYHKICPVCRQEFNTPRSTKRYCSQHCRVVHKRAVKKQYRIDNYAGAIHYRGAKNPKERGYAPKLFEDGYLNPIMNGYCDGCQYCKSFAVSSKATFCGYILIEGHRRGCPAGKGCTKKVNGKTLNIPDTQRFAYGEEIKRIGQG